MQDVDMTYVPVCVKPSNMMKSNMLWDSLEFD